MGDTVPARVIPAGSALPAYDDYRDMRACRGGGPLPAVWDALVDRAAAHGVAHLSGGAVDRAEALPYAGPEDVDALLLIVELAQAPHPRLRDALVALLLLHPEYAAEAREALDLVGPDTPTWMSILARLLAAAALGHADRALWAGTPDGYRPLDVADLAAAYGLPSPEEDDGRALLLAMDRAVRGESVALDYAGGWRAAARHALRSAIGAEAYRCLVEGGVLPGHRVPAGAEA